jgi:alpha-tubulin suppressor-like RCC1 family protein
LRCSKQLENGKLFCFGNNNYGQLGIQNCKSNNYPIELKFFKNEKLKDLACGDRFTIAIDNLGQVFSWGYLYGSRLTEIVPTKVDFLGGKNIIQISCGSNHCLALESINLINLI